MPRVPHLRSAAGRNRQTSGQSTDRRSLEYGGSGCRLCRPVVSAMDFWRTDEWDTFYPIRLSVINLVELKKFVVCLSSPKWNSSEFVCLSVFTLTGGCQRTDEWDTFHSICLSVSDFHTCWWLTTDRRM